MGPRYDPERLAGLYDAYGEQEWDRHERTAFTRVSFHLHRHYLTTFVRPGDRVLEVGAGAGRFTVELARLGAGITVTDLSPGQLELNARNVAAAGLEDRIEARQIADVLDLARFEPETFDAVVCYGGPLSYVLDDADRGIAELLRVSKAGAPVLLSVMSAFGSLRVFLGGLWDDMEREGIEPVQRVFDTGDLPEELSTLGAMHLYRWAELRELLERAGCEILAASAANFLSTADEEAGAAWMRDPQLWERFLAWELRVCAEPGAIDGGTHIIAVVRKRSPDL